MWHRNGRLQRAGGSRGEAHLIVTHEVTNDGVDRDQLSSMAKQAREAMGVEELSAVAGRGYFKGEEILACRAAGITVFVPKTLTSERQRLAALAKVISSMTQQRTSTDALLGKA